MSSSDTETMKADESAVTKGLTLAELNDDLAELMTLRTDMTEAAEDTAAIDAEIEKYLEALPGKVDRVAGFLRHLKTMELLAEAEEERLKARRRWYQHAREHLQKFVLFVLAKLPPPRTGSTRRLEGKTATLSRVLNGGRVSVVIDNEALIPPEYYRYTLKLTHQEMASLKLLGTPAETKAKRDVDKEAIHDDLNNPCPACLNEQDRETCQFCGGTGLYAVPGCRLEGRGYHLRIT